MVSHRVGRVNDACEKKNFNIFYAIGQILKVLTNEKRDGLKVVPKVVLIDRSHFKLYKLKCSKNLCRPPSCESPKTVEGLYYILEYLECLPLRPNLLPLPPPPLPPVCVPLLGTKGGGGV